MGEGSDIKYANVLIDPTGAYFWKVGVRAITVYVNGQPRPVVLPATDSSGGGGTGTGGGGQGGFPATAVVDSGMPIILASVGIVNGIYGALGIGPASDGQCTPHLSSLTSRRLR